jgi:hypothetical protein
VGALLLRGEGTKARLGVIGAVVLARTLLQVPFIPLRYPRELHSTWARAAALLT